MNQELINKLKSYFEHREDISFSYLFGSTVSGNTHSESDIDIGVYFIPLEISRSVKEEISNEASPIKNSAYNGVNTPRQFLTGLIPNTKELEYESDTEYKDEDKIWLDLEKITGKKTDLVVLNRAPSTLAYAILQNGQKIFARDENLLTRLYLAISLTAEDFRYFVSDFIKISERSNSLSEIDRDRLARMAIFLEKEMEDFGKFKQVDQLAYTSDTSVKRNIERWVENIVNSSIDMAKILLASERKQIPETYRLIIENLGTLDGFDPSVATSLSSFSKMRNILAHEHLDIRFGQIKRFTQESEESYKYLISFIRKILE